MDLTKIELSEHVWTAEDEAYVNSDEFKEYCRLMDEALAEAQAEEQE